MSGLISLEREIRDLLQDIYDASSIDNAQIESDLGILVDSVIPLADIQTAVIDVAADQTLATLIAAPTGGDTIWVTGWYVGASVASGSYKLFDGAAALTGTIPVGINGGGVVKMLVKCTADTALKVTTVGSAIDGILEYIIVPFSGS